MKYIVIALALLVAPSALSQTMNGAGSTNIGDDQVDMNGGANNGTVNAYNGTVNRTDTVNNNTRINNSTRDNSVNNEATGGRGGRGGRGGKAESNSSATGGSVGDTSSSSNNTIANDSVATVGDTSATVGNTTSSSDNSNSNDSQGGDVEFNYNSSTAENAASSAASVLTGYCQSGGSAQNFKGGFSLNGNDQFCDRIRMADYYWIQYERQVTISATFNCEAPDPALAPRCLETGERMLESLDKAWENTEKANALLDSGEFAAKVEKSAGPFTRIGGILAMLILL